MLVKAFMDGKCTRVPLSILVMVSAYASAIELYVLLLANRRTHAESQVSAMIMIMI